MLGQRRANRPLVSPRPLPAAGVQVGLAALWVLSLAAFSGLVSQLSRPSVTVTLDGWLFTSTEVRGSGVVASLGRVLVLTGQRAVLLPLVAVAIVSVWHRTTRARVVASLMALAGSAIAVAVLKAVVHRPPPHAHLGPLLANAGSSFPSGHVAGAAAAGWGLALLLPCRSNLLLRLSVMLVAATAATTGVMLPGYHWISDCAGGLLAASTVVLLLEFLAARAVQRRATWTPAPLGSGPRSPVTKAAVPRGRGNSCLHRSPFRPTGYFRMLTARAITRAVVDRLTALCSPISTLAQRDNGMVSVGEKAVALVKLT